MTSDEIRRTFIEFFVQRDHLRLPSASLVPNEYDPSVLFTIAGMVPLKFSVTATGTPTSCLIRSTRPFGCKSQPKYIDQFPFAAMGTFQFVE